MEHQRLHFVTLDSTHTYALKHADSLAHGTIITADDQTAGQGRSGRKWISGSGDSVLLSIVLKGVTDPDEAKLITPLMAMAALRLLAEFDVRARIKWPNDVIVNGKKIAGILSTAAYCFDAISHVVVSVGVNVGQEIRALDAIDIPATSIFAETGLQKTPDSILEPLISKFDALYELFVSEGFKPLFEEWRSSQILMGRKISLLLGNEIVEGTVTAFGENGTIELTLMNGTKMQYQMGEVGKVF